MVVTRHELEEVARYWCRAQLANCFDCFYFEQTGSYEWRLHVYSDQRLCAIESVIGSDRLRTIWQEAESSYRHEEKIGDEEWRLFKSGTEDERAAWLAVNGFHASYYCGANSNGPIPGSLRRALTPSQTDGLDSSGPPDDCLTDSGVVRPSPRR